jgi:hypothetical protein
LSSSSKVANLSAAESKLALIWYWLLATLAEAYFD